MQSHCAQKQSHLTLPRTIYDVVGGFRQDVTEMEGWYLSWDICMVYGFAKMWMLDDVIVITSSRRASKGILDLDYKKAYREGGQAFDVV
jgi:hypothetical protein